MIAVHKFELSTARRQEIRLPVGAEILHIGHDTEGRLSAWASCNTDNPIEPVSFFVYCTGEEITAPELWHYATLEHDGQILHIFATC